MDRSRSVELRAVGRLAPQDILKALKDKDCLDDLRCLQSKPFGYEATYGNLEAAEKLMALDSFMLLGQTITLNKAGYVKIYVKVFDLPYGVSDDELRHVLTDFGDLIAYRRDRIREYPDIESGVRTATMYLERSIPNFVNVAGFRAKIWYRGQVLACNICSMTGHFAKECPNIECRRCKGKGHFARDCSVERRCFGCQSTEHLIRDCPKGRGGIGRRTADQQEQSEPQLSPKSWSAVVIGNVSSNASSDEEEDESQRNYVPGNFPEEEDERDEVSEEDIDIDIDRRERTFKRPHERKEKSNKDVDTTKKTKIGEGPT